MRPTSKSLTAKDTTNKFVGVTSLSLLRIPAMKQKLIKIFVKAVKMFVVTRMPIAAVDIGHTAGRIEQAIIQISCI